MNTLFAFQANIRDIKPANIFGDARFGPGSASDAFYRQIISLDNAAPGADAALPGAFGDPLGCAGFVDARASLAKAAGSNVETLT